MKNARAMLFVPAGALVTMLLAACEPEPPTLALLAPGQVLQFEFAQLPPTLYAVHTGRDEPARLTARLPDNYTDVGTFPLLVYLEGGHGGAATESDLARLRSVTRDRDFIVVTMPLFKRTVDTREPHDGLMISLDDLPVLAGAYDAMLTRLRAAIPNIDVTHSALGGFSNGAQVTSMLVSSQDPTTLGHYRNFYLIDGGLDLSGLHKRAMRDRRFLLMVGGRDDDRARRMMLDMSAILREVAAHYRIDMERIIMHGVGHAFPAEYESALRDWLYRVADLPREAASTTGMETP